MTKPEGVRWLEEQTGQVLDRPVPGSITGRHLSLRVPVSLAGQLERLAAERGETLSQVTRRLLVESLDRRADPDRETIDAAIATLEAVRRRLGPPAA